MKLWEQAESKEYGSGIPQEDIVGFRTPFLAYGGPLFTTLKEEGLIYDCTIEEGNHWEQDGTDFRWPYTLDNGSPGHTEGWSGNPSNPDAFEVPSIPGFWQLPNHVAIIPTPQEAEKHGVDYSIAEKIAENIKWFNAVSNKITMFDYNLWVQAKLTNKEFLVILKHNLDLRLKGNRAPLMIGAHSEYLSSDKNKSCANAADLRGRQRVFEEFIEYALSFPEVRVVPPIDIITWCRDPDPLDAPISSVKPSSSTIKQSFSINVGSDFIKLNIPHAQSGIADLNIYTMSGRLVSKKSINVGSGVISLSTKNFTQGAYILDVEGLGAKSFLITK